MAKANFLEVSPKPGSLVLTDLWGLYAWVAIPEPHLLGTSVVRLLPPPRRVDLWASGQALSALSQETLDLSPEFLDQQGQEVAPATRLGLGREDSLRVLGL